MNILPKKSWHVRTKANIERVRKDEEKAAAEETERQRRIAVAEQEARTDLLRARAKKHKLEPDTGSESQPKIRKSSDEGEVELFGGNKHVNFFSELEEGKGQSGGNAEYEREKKEEKEKYEKSIGLLTYLGQSAVESQTAATTPWYFKAREKPEASSSSGQGCKHQDEFERKKKSIMDPMRTMNDYLEKKQKHEDVKHNRDPYKKKHKHKHRHKDSKKAGKVSSGSKTIEQLRAERLHRERAERARTEELLIKSAGGNIPSNEPKVEMDERQRRYNSQFNPDFVRKRKQRESHY